MDCIKIALTRWCPTCRGMARSVEFWPTPTPVSERLPEDGTRVLGYFDGCGWYGMIFDNGRWRSQDSSAVNDRECVTHWLRMPPKPE